MGQDGWLGLGWPTEYGGQGRSAMDQYIMFDEVQRSGAPFPFVTVTTMGPSLMRFGTAEQKAKYLPGMLKGDLNFAVGYTEPGSGTDLASLRTAAVLDGDEWVINGSKVYTSGANQPTSSGSPAAPIPTCPSTRASRSSWCRRPRPASAGPRCTPSVTS